MLAQRDHPVVLDADAPDRVGGPEGDADVSVLPGALIKALEARDKR